MVNIATILTCYNRREKTLHCLQNLYDAIDFYNNQCILESGKLNVALFLTDDACTDGTVEAVENLCQDKQLCIIKGTGNCFWAGGMRLAWKEALKKKEIWDFYLLLNDDTFLKKDAFIHLMEAYEYSISTYGKSGIYSGITCDTKDESNISYGGYVWTNYFLGKHKILTPAGVPQMCDKANSNIMLVDSSVVDKIGIFYEGYKHAAADYDYSITARKNGFPVLVTSVVCGQCDYDHSSQEEKKRKLLTMSLKQRKAYFVHPLHSMQDTLTYDRRNLPLRYVMCCVGRYMNLYCPRIYYWLSDLRGVKKGEI